MNCFECAKANDGVPAVGVCRHCGAGLCVDHLAEAAGYRVGGTAYACNHTIPRTEPLRGIPAEIAATTRNHTAGVS